MELNVIIIKSYLCRTFIINETSSEFDLPIVQLYLLLQFPWISAWTAGLLGCWLLGPGDIRSSDQQIIII